MAVLKSITKGIARAQGGRPYQEDDFAVADETFAKSGLALYSVFDGHGGGDVSHHAAHSIPKLIVKSKYFDAGQYSRALQEAFVEEDRILYKEMEKNQLGCKGGSTATVVLITQSTLYVANVGDSSAVLARKQTATTYHAVRLSKEHKVDDSAESKRLEDADAVIRNDRVVGAGHAINMSRALGDFDFKLPRNSANADWISPIPHIAEVELTSSDDFIVIASDGLWNNYSEVQLLPLIAEMRARGQTPQAICDGFCSKLNAIENSDNVTMILIDLEWEEAEAEASNPDQKQTNGNEEASNDSHSAS